MVDAAIDTPGPKGPGAFRRLAGWWGPYPLLQAVAIVAIFALLALLAHNTAATMSRLGATPGFAFLGRSANFAIGEGLIPFEAGNTYARAIIVGLLNTILVAVWGIVLATLLGVTLGVARLSRNLLLANVVRWYIEIVRNTPLLLQLFLWIAIARALPPPKRAPSVLDIVFLSNRGVFIPGIFAESLPWLALAGVVVVLAIWAAALLLARRHGRLTVSSGATLTLGALAAAALWLWLAGAQLSVEIPQLTGFNIVGGYALTPEFAALLTGLTVKFSASIAEIVRAGIQSVKQGQWEAARALGLGDAQILRLVVLPQALRVITPLTTSNYLDLVKDSSLAVAIGYPDLVNILNTTANTTGQAFEALAILIGLYLVLNLFVSYLMNRYNRRVALRGGRPA